MKPAAALLPLLALVMAACGANAPTGSPDPTGSSASTGSTGSTGSTAPEVTAPRSVPAAGQEAAAVTAVNGLGLDLLRAGLGTAKGNVAVSPWSIATALGMLRTGARGTTAAQLDAVLHSTDAAALHAGMNALDLLLAERNGTFPWGAGEQRSIELSAANRAFTQQGFPFEPAFLQTLAADYGSTIGEVDYERATGKARATINGWVNERTKQRIRELIPDGVLDAMTRLVLVNAVYLRADWQVPFAKESTKPATFHAAGGDVTAPFMAGAERWGWAEGDGWQAVELPYVDGKLAMTIVVPAAGRFDEVTGHLDGAMLAKLAAVSNDGEVTLRLPRFDIAKATDLGAALQALGVIDAFDPNAADLSGITTAERLYVSAALHQANITVDEQGTVAAAATVIVVSEASAAVELHELTVDRPFLFLLRDRPTGTLLFAGQVTNPAAKA